MMIETVYNMLTVNRDDMKSKVGRIRVGRFTRVDSRVRRPGSLHLEATDVPILGSVHLIGYFDSSTSTRIIINHSPFMIPEYEGRYCR